jgi:small subunit ribosomal protein S9
MSRNNRGSASAKSTGNARGFSREKRDEDPLLARVRIVPASPSYFTATPRYIDDLLFLSALLRKYQLLPRLPTGEAPRVAWKTLAQYKAEVAEPVRAKSYKMLLALLKSLNYIHPSLIPGEVTMALEKFKRLAQPQDNRAKPIEVDEDGISKAVGRRKSSSAKVYVVEGEGKVLINGKTLSEYFGRMHDRESAVWALKASQRLDKYNVWALVKGGGTTGQADAIALGLARALLAHEPDLKPALRRGEFAELSLDQDFVLTSSQPVSSLVIPEESRGRSQASSKPVKCPPGSSGNLVPYICIIFVCTIQIHVLCHFPANSSPN